MSNYTKATNFATKDSLTSGDPNKVVKGTELDNEFNSISGAVATKADLASPSFTGTPAAPTAAAGNNTTQIATTAYVRGEIGTLGTMASQNASSVAVTGGTITGITDLAVADGGTGASSITANSVVLGNGTSPLSGNLVAPGSNGNILTSNGTTWTASPLTLNNKQVFTSSGTFSVPAGVSRVKVTVIGAGGNGTNGVEANQQGGGGGAGGVVVDYVAVTAGGTATVTVGTNAGTRASSFAGSSTITASGGSNAGAWSPSAAIIGVSGSATLFGVAFYSANISRSNASTAFTARDGVIYISGTNVSTAVGSCYNHGYGVGGGGGSGAFVGRQTPIGYGAGGGGGGTDAGNTTAGTGTNGLVVVEW